MIDTHCHLSYPDFDADRDAVIARALAAGVSGFLTVATDENDWRRTLDIAEGRSQVRAALGIHPNYAGAYSARAADEMRILAQANPRVTAFGETGLDFFRDHAPREKQREAFRGHLSLADELKKPFILHCRAAEPEMMDELRRHRDRTGHALRGVWHCFTSTRVFAKQASELDLYFGIGGILTYPKADELRAAVAELPEDRLLLETDCPFLPPQGWRGQRNEPAYLAKVLEKLAEIRQTTPDEAGRITTGNALRLFGSFQ